MYDNVLCRIMGWKCKIKFGWSIFQILCKISFADAHKEKLGGSKALSISWLHDHGRCFFLYVQFNMWILHWYFFKKYCFKRKTKNTASEENLVCNFDIWIFLVYSWRAWFDFFNLKWTALLLWPTSICPSLHNTVSCIFNFFLESTHSILTQFSIMQKVNNLHWL